MQSGKVAAPMTRAGVPRIRVLLFAEAVTLAHVARPICFARGLDPGRYEVAVATSLRAAQHVLGAGLAHLPLESVEPAAFLSALADGRPVYDAPTLKRYVEGDRVQIERFKPDLIVGDFRLSLSISARRAGVPYVAISSAYWSPYYSPTRWPVPVLPMTRRLPLALAHALFRAARPLAFAAHCGPLNSVRRFYGMEPLPRDLRRVYTDADEVVYSDVPELFPTAGLPPAHRFLGPALWEPTVAPPDWWHAVPGDRPPIYVTFGSSGDAALLPLAVRALSSLPVSLLVASAGAEVAADPLPDNVRVATYLPGLQAAQRSRLVICNGGSLTAYQALAGGAAVLGIAGNLDQFLNMQALERAGVGRLLRADRLSAARLRAEVEAMVGDGQMLEAVRARRAGLAMHCFEDGAAQVVKRLVG